MSKKVFLVGNSFDYLNWIEAIGFERTKDLAQANLVFFTGGEDVHPNLYGQKPHHTVFANSARDAFEMKAFNQAIKLNIPMVGVCRGGQFLTVMNGGKLVQDMSHPSRHNISTINGESMLVTSSHHNQFLVEESITGLKENEDYTLMGWTTKLSPYHFGEVNDYKFPADYKEPEVILWNKVNHLSIQPHPEWMDLNCPFIKWCQELVQIIVK